MWHEKGFSLSDPYEDIRPKLEFRLVENFAGELFTRDLFNFRKIKSVSKRKLVMCKKVRTREKLAVTHAN